jgi:hypothetical protein
VPKLVLAKGEDSFSAGNPAPTIVVWFCAAAGKIIIKYCGLSFEENLIFLWFSKRLCNS